MKPVQILIKDHLSLGTTYYDIDDKAKCPLWYAKLLEAKELVEILDYKDFDYTIKRTLPLQRMNDKLVEINKDFYIECCDYLKNISRNNKSILANRIEQLNNFIEVRKHIMLKLAILGENDNVTGNMTFEEQIIFNNIIQMLHNMTGPLDHVFKELRG
jgi:hypothetical protein